MLNMNIADKITLLRIILAPVFFIFYFLPAFFPSLFTQGSGWTVPVLWIVVVAAELTDMFDGMAARKYKIVSDFGKLFDPFADTFLHVTCFLCFVIDGIFPVILFLLVLYREYSILLVRNLMLRKGVSMGSRIGGKIKTVTYVTAGAFAMLDMSLRRLEALEFLLPYIKTTAIVIFVISVIFSLTSFLDYVSVYKKAEQKNSG